MGHPPQQPNQGWPQQPQQPPYPQQGYPQQQYAQPAAPAASGLDENVASALCYLLGLITGILFLVIEPYSKNKNIRFHAFQSIFFHVGSIAFWIVWTIISSILASMMTSLWFVTSGIGLLISLAMLCGWLFLMYKAYNREKFKLPVIGDLAEKQA